MMKAETFTKILKILEEEGVDPDVIKKLQNTLYNDKDDIADTEASEALDGFYRRQLGPISPKLAMGLDSLAPAMRSRLLQNLYHAKDRRDRTDGTPLAMDAADEQRLNALHPNAGRIGTDPYPTMLDGNGESPRATSGIRPSDERRLEARYPHAARIREV